MEQQAQRRNDDDESGTPIHRWMVTAIWFFCLVYVLVYIERGLDYIAGERQS